MIIRCIKLRLILTKHVKRRMAEKGVTIEQIKTVIRRGAKVRQTDGFEATYTYIKVAFKVMGDKYIIKTIKID